MTPKLLTFTLVGLLACAPLAILADPITDSELLKVDTDTASEDSSAATEDKQLATENQDIEDEDTHIVSKLNKINTKWEDRINEANSYLQTTTGIEEQGEGPFLQTQSISQKLSEQQLKNNLLAFASIIGPAKYINTFQKSPSPNTPLIKQVTTGVKTSDDLSVSLSPSEAFTEPDNNIMSADNFMNKEQYTSKEQEDALNYIHLVAQDYRTIYFGIDENALNRALGEMTTGASTWLNKQLLNSKSFLLFQAQERTYFAFQSMVDSNLYYLFAQRATTDLQKTSALKNQNYVIHKIVNSGKFYEDLKTKSPTWLLRTMVQLAIYHSRMLQARQQVEQRQLGDDAALLKIALLDEEKQVEQKSEAVNKIIETAAVNQDIR